jgi:hypothetical protein
LKADAAMENWLLGLKTESGLRYQSKKEKVKKQKMVKQFLYIILTTS